MARSLLLMHSLLSVAVAVGVVTPQRQTESLGVPAAEVVAALVIRLVVLAVRAMPVVEE
jgi:hypothetical protein